MDAGIYGLIPGLKAAQEEYVSSSIEAFAGIEPSICGRIQVRPFTAQMFVELDMTGNRFFVGREQPDEGDICAMLWRISPLYARGDDQTRHDFTALLEVLFIEEGSEAIVRGIQAYIARAWSGMPLLPNRLPGAGGSDVSTWPSHIVHTLAKEYGWTEEYILNLPFRRLWQYLNRVKEDLNPDYKERCAKAMDMRAKWLQAQQNN